MNKLAESKKCAVPQAVKEAVELRVAAFNEKHRARSKSKYVAQFKGKYIYMMSTSSLAPEERDPVFRLTYDGDLEKLDFVIYKYSSDKYDPSEWGFPGTEHIDGTLEGAMKAGVKAYLR